MGSIAFVGATAKQEKYLYLGGPLLAGVAIVALSGLAPLVIPATAARTLMWTENIWLYGGLAVFGGFTLYDIQKSKYTAKNLIAYGSADRVSSSPRTRTHGRARHDEARCSQREHLARARFHQHLRAHGANLGHATEKEVDVVAVPVGRHHLSGMILKRRLLIPRFSGLLYF